MNQQQPQQFHPMNSPYLSQNYSGQRRTSNNRSINNNNQQSYGNEMTVTHINRTGMQQTYESQRLLQYSQVSSGSDNNYKKQVYSRSSTNIIGGDDRQLRGMNNNNMSRQQHQNHQQYSLNTSSHQQNGMITNHNNPNQSYPNNNKLQSPNNQPFQQSEQLSTKYLNDKIQYLQNQLQQLNRFINDQSKHSYNSSGHQYEEVAIENAQLTIKVQELQEEIQKLKQGKERAEQELVQLGVQYEKEHSINNQLREKLMETNSKLTQIQRQLNQAVKRQQQISKQTNKKQSKPHSSHSLPSHQQKNAYTATLQRQNTRLNQQIQTLLSKMHNLNLQINQQQSAKDQLMTKLNQQLEQIEKLRKQLSDQQVQKLQLQSMNQYLKEEINYVNELSVKRQKELQEKYIKEQVEKSFNSNNNYSISTKDNNGEDKRENQQLRIKVTELQNYTLKLQTNYKQLEAHYKQLQAHCKQLQQNNHQLQSHISEIESQHSQQQKSQQQIYSLKHHIRQLQSQIIHLTHSNQSLNYQVTELKKKPITPPRQSKSQPFKQLFSIEQSLKQQIRLLQQQLSQEKDRHQLINKKYTEMMENRQTRIYELQGDIKKLQAQNRTLKIQVQDKRKQRDQARDQCQRLQQKVQEIRSSKSFISIANNSSRIERQTTDQKIQRIIHQERIKYQETIRNNNEINKKLLQQKNLQLNLYHNTINSLQQQLTNTRTEMHQLLAKLDLKDKELKDKNYLVMQLQQLQNRHEQLINQVKLIKKNKSTLQQQWKINQQTIRKDKEQEINQLNQLLKDKNLHITQMDQQINQLQQINHQLKQQITTLNQQLSNHQHNHPQQSTNPQPSHSSCPLCPQVLKQFNVYKQLMQLKFQTMNQMLDQLKISFIRAQFEIKEEINKDKSKYDHWIQKYDTHDKEYRVLMERLWEWEKINARNTMVREEGYATFASFGSKEQYINQNGLKIINNINQQKAQAPNNYNNMNKNNHQTQPANHLSEIEYDLYLIKLQNSTLRSQISTLQKQLSQRQHNPQVSKQLQQLKKYSQNLTHQNEQLKHNLSQLMSQKKIININSNKQLSFGNISSEGSVGGMSSKNIAAKRQSIFERYSNIANINTELQQKTRHQEKALASAQLLINKLKKQNDNLIQAKHYLEQQLDRQTHKYRELVKDIESQRQRTRRQHQVNKPHHLSNSQLQLIDRNNIPFEYIKHHPEHKRLQADFVALKRSYLQMDLQFKKAKQYYEEELQKMKIQNDFHKDRIAQLEQSIQQNIKANLINVNTVVSQVDQHIAQNGTMFSFNNNNQNSNNHNLIPYLNPNNINQLKFPSQMSKIKQNAVSMSLSHDTTAFNQTKIKTLQQRVLFLQKQVQLKCQQCQSYMQKYQQLIKQFSSHPRTPRTITNQQNINRIQKLAANIDVSPIQSPQWQTHSAQRQNSDRLFVQNSSNLSFDQKIVDKLKQCIDKKMIELEITPRESSNIVIKATWFIERLSNDIKELRNNIEILKGQRKAIMKERNQLKSIIENGNNQLGGNQHQNQVIERGFKKHHQQHQHYQEMHQHHNNHHQSNQVNYQSTGFEFHKSKPTIKSHHQLHQKIPKLNFDSNDSPLKDQTNENHLPDVIRETLELKNHRRTGLKKFQKQLEILSEN